jgi:toxin YoeB
MYLIKFTKQATKDAKKLKSAGLDKKAKGLINVVSQNPFAYPPAFEPLVGNLQGMYSRRINYQHRFVYEVITDSILINGITYEGTVKVLSMWTHYETI